MDPMAEKYAGWSCYNYGASNPLKFIDREGTDLDDYHFDTQGNLIQRESRPGKDRYYIDHGNGEQEEIRLESDLGKLIRVTYAEMGGADLNSKIITAESIRNRTALPIGIFESARSYGEAIESGQYNAANKGDPNYDKYLDPQGFYKKNEYERKAFVECATAALKVHLGTSGDTGKGVIWYDSIDPSRMNSNPRVTKIVLDVRANGIVGAWKYKGRMYRYMK